MVKFVAKLLISSCLVVAAMAFGIGPTAAADPCAGHTKTAHTFEFTYGSPSGDFWMWLTGEGCYYGGKAYGTLIAVVPSTSSKGYYTPSGQTYVEYWANYNLHGGSEYPRIRLSATGQWSCRDGGSNMPYGGCQ